MPRVSEMTEEKEYPRRKHPRLTGYDYSESGRYFVTICSDHNKSIFSEIVFDHSKASENDWFLPVGRGLAPAVCTTDSTRWYFGGYGVKNKMVGQICENLFEEIEKRFPCLEVEYYVIMPNHIHMIAVLHNPKETAGASPRPTLHDIVCAYKSLVTRYRNKMFGQTGTRIFQTSYYEHIIRNDREYANIIRYISENPARFAIDGKEPF